LAQDYPKPNGFVNDFANQINARRRAIAGKEVRDYQRDTGVQIGVAVVPSLNSMSIDEYSQGLFRTWGVGQYEIDNGVFFVWAPNERQIRIHVGSGLESTLTNAQAARIIDRVRDRFRARRYQEGVNAAVDGVIEVLGPGFRDHVQPRHTQRFRGYLFYLPVRHTSRRNELQHISAACATFLVWPHPSLMQ